MRRLKKADCEVAFLFMGCIWLMWIEFLTAHDTDEERDYESQTADNQISLLVSRLPTRYSGWSAASGPGLSDFVSFVAFCKKSFCTTRRGVYGYGKPQVRRGDRTRNA